MSVEILANPFLGEGQGSFGKLDFGRKNGLRWAGFAGIANNEQALLLFENTCRVLTPDQEWKILRLGGIAPKNLYPRIGNGSLETEFYWGAKSRCHRGQGGIWLVNFNQSEIKPEEWSPLSAMDFIEVTYCLYGNNWSIPWHYWHADKANGLLVTAAGNDYIALRVRKLLKNCRGAKEWGGIRLL